MLRASAAGGALLWFAVACVGSEDRTPLERLPSADARVPLGFTFVSSVRELPDGRIIVTDPRERRFLSVDPRSSSIVPIGRVGRGPGEWTNLFPVIPLGGDSSLMPDAPARRWSWLIGDAIVGQTAADDDVVAATGGLIVGADAGRSVYWVVPATISPGASRAERTERDSVPLVRRRIDAMRPETLVILRDAPAGVTLGADGQVAGISRPVHSVAEQAAVFVDGWVAVARLDPYRVEWRAPSGAWSRGPALGWLRDAPMTAAERDAFTRRHARELQDLERSPPAIREALRRRYTDFPAYVPPFLPGALVAGLDGCLYVRRTPTARWPTPRVDRFDRRGQRVGQLLLDSLQRLVSVGRQHAYIATRDPDDVEWISRHPLPQHRGCA